MVRRHVALIGLSAVPLLVLGVFFVLPVAGMIARGLHGRRQPRRPRRARGAGPAAGAPRAVVHAVVVHRRDRDVAAARPARRRTRCTGWTSRCAAPCARCCWCRSCCRPSWWEWPSGSCSARRARSRFLGLDGSAAAIIAGLTFFNAAVVIRAVGTAWEDLDPRPGEAAAALGASPLQVLRTVTLPALRPGDRLGGDGGVLVLRDRLRRRADPGRAALQHRRDGDLPAHHQPARPAGGRGALGPPAAGDRGPAGARAAAACEQGPHRGAAAGPAAPGPPWRRGGARGHRAAARLRAGAVADAGRRGPCVRATRGAWTTTGRWPPPAGPRAAGRRSPFPSPTRSSTPCARPSTRPGWRCRSAS